MKPFLLLSFAALSFARLGVAGPCVTQSLSQYLTLGATGCTFSGSTFSNFQILSGLNFGTAVPPMAVSIMPTGGIYNPGLTISTNQSASNGSLLEIIFAYEISGAMYINSSVLLSGSSETGNGGVTGIENLCAAGTFTGPDGVSGCTGTMGGPTALDGIQQSDMAAFSKAPFINVVDDLTFDSSGGGTAAGGTFATSFTAVPEPVSITLAGLGLAFAALLRRRPGRVKRQINEEEVQ